MARSQDDGDFLKNKNNKTPMMIDIDFEKFEQLSEEEKKAISLKWADEDWFNYFASKGTVTLEEFRAKLKVATHEKYLEKYKVSLCNDAADALITALSDYEVCVNHTKHNFDKIKEEVQHRINEKLGILGLQGASIDITGIQLDSKIGRSTLWEWAKRMDKIDKEEKIEPFISLFQSEFYKYQTRQYPIQMKHEIIEIDKTSELFPRSLIEIGDDCPERLYLIGNVELLKAEKSVAIIGARAADRNGCSKAYSLAVDFTKKGYVVVSGLALGCDSSAHRGCLDAMGKTIAIVGSGLDIVHPQENVPLQERILQRQGLVLSEQPLGTKASPKTLVRRNRLQAALSQMVVVAQCPVKSGTLYTVDFARKYGKEVFAAQFKYHNEFTSGNDKLLAEGIAKGI